MTQPARPVWRAAGIRRRLLLILGLTTLAIGAASTVALMALLEIRNEVTSVINRELPATTAAVVLARVGERLQDRTLALMAAKGSEARRQQTALINNDLLSLASETERLSHLIADDSGGAGDIPPFATTLANNLRELADQLELQAGFVNSLQDQRDLHITLRERVKQILGPSILVVAEVIGGQQTKDDEIFQRAAKVQGPLLEAERLVGAAIDVLLLAAEMSTVNELQQARDTFERVKYQLRALIPQLPSGLRAELASAVADLADQSGDGGVFSMREGELAARAQADQLGTISRRIATQLKTRIDLVVRSANENIAHAADTMGNTILTNTILLVAVSVTVVLLATLLSYRFVVRDISENLRAVTGAMRRLADGERDAQVPAMERRDEIGDLARVFNVFKSNVFRIERLDRQLAEKSNLLLATFDNMNDGLTVCDQQNCLVAWNPRYLKLYGLLDTEITVGTPLLQVHQLLAERGARAFTNIGEEVAPHSLTTGRSHQDQQFEVRCADGQRVELRSNPMPHGGYVTIHTDITQRRAIESQLLQAQKMEAVGQLTGGLAHDFNNILAVILGNLTQLEAGVKATPDLQKPWQKAMGAADRAARQVARLLAFSRRQRLEPETVNINQLIQGMIDLIEYSLGDGVTLVTELAPELPSVCVDPGQLENTLMNLALNAADALHGKGRLTISTAHGSSDTIELKVSDTGHGIAPKLFDKVFEPFFTTKEANKGSGLGLSMVYGFVKQSGGEIGINSEPGRGTSIWIRLPVVEKHRETAVKVEHIPHTGEALLPQGKGEVILVVDDDKELLKLSAHQLQGIGYQVVTAEDGVEALEKLAGESAVRLLYTDLTMPAPWDGVNLAREVQLRRPSIAILYTSGEVQEISDRSTELLRKPVPLDKLAFSVRRILDG